MIPSHIITAHRARQHTPKQTTDELYCTSRLYTTSAPGCWVAAAAAIRTLVAGLMLLVFALCLAP
jgi:hypothetical protein